MDVKPIFAPWWMESFQDINHNSKWIFVQRGVDRKISPILFNLCDLSTFLMYFPAIMHLIPFFSIALIHLLAIGTWGWSLRNCVPIIFNNGPKKKQLISLHFTRNYSRQNSIVILRYMTTQQFIKQAIQKVISKTRWKLSTNFELTFTFEISLNLKHTQQIAGK